jgi:hypothetical protein
MTSNADWKIYFEKLLSDDLQKSVGLATIETMMKTLSESKGCSNKIKSYSLYRN